MANRADFLSFLDMIDGGGAGKMGGEFEGGGIISQIANLLATPYGSEDPKRRAIAEASNKARRKARGLLDMDAIGTKEEQAAAAERAAATPSVVKRSVPPVTSSPRPQLRPEALVGKTMDQAVGGAQYPSMYRSMDSVVGNMGVPAAPVGRTIDQAVGGAQYPSMYRSMDSVVGQTGMLPTIYPSQAAQVDAQNQANREAMRQSMSEVPRTQYDMMSRQERSQRGLPVGGLDRAFAGTDAFKEYSGRGMSTGDPEFDAFMQRARGDATLAGFIDNPVAIRNIFNMYKQQRAAQAGM